ncbi:hypothetical protein [Lysinibacillus xylanilyticus]|uniref:DUF3169 domain-containing protein n=1 Tax=Lysinibacillus xylanilyticus TaxID=582475 RepID=A0ABT4EMZ8_9BACI|nr:hypothetical protein [Lysinibacillus xylanilyticus]MCY9547027.1 hypothetical protein [Lysinibacillus xylanilyticus]
MNNKNLRFWEFYLVRYFVGTVVGTLLILFLIYYPESGIYKLINKQATLPGIKISKFEMSYLWLFGFVGLAYCYLASAPILVFHSVRSIFSRFSETSSRYKNLFKFSIILPLIVVLLLLLLSYLKNPERHTFFLLSISVASIIIGYQIILIIFLIFRKNLFQFYKDLATKRSDNDQIVSEYVESYRHLREHGNAFSILLMEIILCFILYNINSLSLLSIILTFWIIPAGSVWVIGTYLESKIHELK